MNIDEPLRAISSVLSQSGKLGLSVGPGRWHVLFGGRQRPLLMPAGEYRQQKQWLPHFTGGRMRTLYAAMLLKLNALMPALGLLPEFRMRHAADVGWRHCRLRDGGVSTGPWAAIQIGTTGPYQKASALLISDEGVGLALAKIALASSADVMVVAEANWLRALEEMDELATHVPRLLAEGTLPNGRRYLVTSLAPSTRVTTDFTAAHARFLSRLGRSRMEIMRFEASPCCESLERALEEIAPMMTCDEFAQLRGALAECRRSLHDFVGPFVLSQGDFASWNIRLHPQGIFVFDWEYAQRHANPLADLFHYHLIQRAAAGRRVGRWFLASVMRRAQTFARQYYPESRWRASKVSALALAYLLEVLLHYSRASGKVDRGDHVMHGYWSLVERRSTWMAA
jgi:hypothetical protein